MSSWDEYILQEEINQDFMADISALDDDELQEAVMDSITIALDQSDPGDPEYLTGLCAASVAAIWNGAPFSATDVADEFPLIRDHIGRCPEELQERALQLLDTELEKLGSEAPEGLETYVEAVS